LIDQPLKLDEIGNINVHAARRLMQNFRDGDRSNIWLVWRLAMLNCWANRQ
jgi:hypothetical protein